MADQTLRIVAPPGLSSVKLMLAEDGASTFTSDSAITLTELGSTGQYEGTRTAVTDAGVFLAHLQDSSGKSLGVVYWFRLANATGVYRGQVFPPDAIVGEVVLAASQPNYAPAKAGNQMALVDDAITAAKFDESTAFPLKSADAGSTAVARTGPDGDTLKTLSDQIDATATSAGLASLQSHGDTNWSTATGFSTHSAADVWSVETRLLTGGTNIVLAKGTGITGFNDLDAAGVRTAVGLAAANLDAQFDAIPENVEAAILDEGDATPLLAAIAAKVEEFVLNDGDSAATLAAIAAAVWSNATRELTTAFPANFAALGINDSGHVLRVVLVDTTTTNADMRGTDGANTTTPPSATAIWQLAGAIDGKTPQEAMRIIAAAAAGKLSGVGTGTETFLGLDGVTDRLRVTLDAEFNRTSTEYL